MSASTSKAAPVSSEDVLSRKTDECLANAIVKGGLGLSAGIVASVILFRRRAFPVWLLTGAGVGSAYTECQMSFNPTAVPGYRIAAPDGSTSTSSSLVSKAESAYKEAKAKVESQAPKAV